jgi:hypothetical protein
MVDIKEDKIMEELKKSVVYVSELADFPKVYIQDA